MKNIMHTYNFIIINGKINFNLDVDAKTEDEAIDIVRREYPIDDGYRYILL